MTSSSTNDFTYKSNELISKKVPVKKLKKSSSEYNLTTLNSQKNQRIKDFEILKELGRGAYGTVHLAKRDNDGNQYALKVVDKMFLSKVLYQ